MPCDCVSVAAPVILWALGLANQSVESLAFFGSEHLDTGFCHEFSDFALQGLGSEGIEEIGKLAFRVSVVGCGFFDERRGMRFKPGAQGFVRLEMGEDRSQRLLRRDFAVFDRIDKPLCRLEVGIFRGVEPVDGNARGKPRVGKEQS